MNTSQIVSPLLLATVGGGVAGGKQVPENILEPKAFPRLFVGCPVYSECSVCLIFLK